MAHPRAVKRANEDGRRSVDTVNKGLIDYKSLLHVKERLILDNCAF